MPTTITHQLTAYTGREKLLVIGIDVGTTLSGVSYALLEPGKVPRIQPVTRFFGQRVENGKSKVRSAICYDQDGNIIAAGPETDPEVNSMLYDLADVRRAECFKLRLLSPRLAADKRTQLEKNWPPPARAEDEGEHDGIEQAEDGKVEGTKESRGERDESAPSRDVVERQSLIKRRVLRPVTDDFKTPDQVFTDFLQYLFKSAKEYITEKGRNVDPTFTWSSIERNTYFVLTHPNEWEKLQKLQMRDAAVAAGLVNTSIDANRIIFVTEGEANLHFCLDKSPELQQERGGLMVVDCGGGTIDLSAYSQNGKGRYKQIVSPDCLLQGSIFVTSRARDYFKGKFKTSQFGSDSEIETMARAFDKPEGVKCIFSHPNKPYFVKFGYLRDNDRKWGVSGGKFKVGGEQMAKFFEPAVQDIIDGIENQRRNIKDGISIKYVMIVGGFGRSQYLYQKLSEHFNNGEFVILRSDITHLNKAVADGAVSWYLNRFVSSRSRGAIGHHPFDRTDPDHWNRESVALATVNTADNWDEAADVNQAFALRMTEFSPQQPYAFNNGHKLPGRRLAANRRRESPITAGSSSQARTRVNYWQERRGTGEIGTGPQNSDYRTRKDYIGRLKTEVTRSNHYKGHSSEENTGTGDMKLGSSHRTIKGKDHHSGLHKLSPFVGTSDTISVADAAELAGMLNAPIEQRVVSARESPISRKELEGVMNGLTGYVGSLLCNDLHNNPNIGPDPLVTQVALQSGLVNACSYIINNGIPFSSGAKISRTRGEMEKARRANPGTRKAQLHTSATTCQTESSEFNQKYLGGALPPPRTAKYLKKSLPNFTK